MTRKKKITILAAAAAAIVIVSVALGLWARTRTSFDVIEVDRSGSAAVVTADPDARTVYVTPFGHCYQRPGCGHLLGNGHAVSYEIAVSRGLRPCEHCKPDP